MNIHFNKIYVIESLQSNEKHTGTELHNNLLKYQSITHPDFESILKTPSSKQEWNQLFKEIEIDCKENNNSPIIHFEVHGDSNKKGLVLSSNDLITWEELYQNLVPINIVIKNELFITMAVCFGNFWLSSAFLNRPAAFRGIIGSFQEIYEWDLIIRFEAFYQELFNSFDLNLAYESLKESNPDLPNKYGIYSAEQVFALTYMDYEKIECSHEALSKRAINSLPYKMSRTEKRKFIRNFIKKEKQNRNLYFQEFYRKFFMLDIYPELADTIEFRNSIPQMKNWFKGVD